MFIGHELYSRRWPRWLGVLDRGRMGLETRQALEQLSINLPAVDIPVAKLSGGQRQAVAVARAVLWAREAVLMDEPTASLGKVQSDIVCETMRATARKGLGVVAVSHDIPRMLEVADRVVVMRLGRIVDDGPVEKFDLTRIVGLMVGQDRETVS
jgi:simple sugar transport system ATP-binding protein